MRLCWGPDRTWRDPTTTTTTTIKQEEHNEEWEQEGGRHLLQLGGHCWVLRGPQREGGGQRALRPRTDPGMGLGWCEQPEIWEGQGGGSQVVLGQGTEWRGEWGDRVREN